MSVDASIRRKGIATLLIKQVEQYAITEGFSKVILDTGAMMKAACSFYERCGYTKKKTYSDKLGGIEVLVQPFEKDLRWSPYYIILEKKQHYIKGTICNT